MPTQLALALPEPRPKFRHGGARPGAGRPSKDGATKHDARPPLRKDRPLHVTRRAQKVLPSLTRDVPHAVVRAALDAVRKRTEEEGAPFQVVHYSIQSDHVHLIVEATNKKTLSRGVQGLVIRIARQLNKKLGRAGKVWNERFHRHDLKTPTEVRNVLRYVLLNVRKHARVDGRPFADPCSSGATFDGWKSEVFVLPADTEPWRWVRPRTWLLRTGWKRYGPISPFDTPGFRKSGRHAPVGGPR